MGSQDTLTILESTLEADPSAWSVRKCIVEILFAEGKFTEAEEKIWRAPQIPTTDVDLAFALKILSKHRPDRGARLVEAILDRIRHKPEKALAIARALFNEGMLIQAARFYGFALAEDQQHLDPNLEDWLIWADQSGTVAEMLEKPAMNGDKPPLQAATPKAVPAPTLPNHTAVPAMAAHAPNHVSRPATPTPSVVGKPAAVPRPTLTGGAPVLQPADEVPHPHPPLPPLPQATLRQAAPASPTR